MRFAIERASQPLEQPCPEAVRETYMARDVHIANDPSELPELRRRTWFTEGTNHRCLENGTIVRDMGEREGWFVHLDTLQDLVAFRRRHGNLILMARYWVDDPTLLIYDAMIE